MACMMHVIVRLFVLLDLDWLARARVAGVARAAYCKRYNMGTIQNRFSSNTGFFGFP